MKRFSRKAQSPLGSPTPTQPGGSPTHLGRALALWEAPQEVCWLLGREPKPLAYSLNVGKTIVRDYQSF